MELAEALGVSRTVVRDALSELERDGYLERVRGIGTLVNRDVLMVENRMDQKLEFNKMIRAIGRVPHSDNLMVTRETATPELMERLALDPEKEHTLVFVRRRVLADETPVLYSTDILPLALFGGKRLAAEKPEADAAETEEAEHSTARRRLSATALALRELYDSLMRTPKAEDENPAMIFDRAAERVCRGCSLRTICWERDYAKTYNALNDATPALLTQGRGRGGDFPSYFTDRCIRFPSFLSAVNSELSAFLLRRQYRGRLADTRAQAAGQYAQLSELLSGAAETLEAQPTAAETLLTYRVGAALRPKEGENVSGDSVTHFETEDGRLCLLLSDGMGCGEEARRESALAVRLLERFLRAGVETSGALKTLNSALTLRAEVSESFTTIDLLTLSLRDGAAEVYKYGAAPSYVKRGARVRRITGSCLPAGLQSADTRPETTGFTLEKGSFFVMLSDGVADVNDDGWLMALLEKFQGDDPQALASAILAAGRERRGGDDDCAVLALYRDKDGGAVEV